MKPLLKILIPLFFVAAIGLFVAFKSGVFDGEQPASQPLKERKQEQAVSPKSKTEARAASSSSAKELSAIKPKSLRAEEPAETTQNVNATPVVMPSSKSVIIINPTIDKKSIPDGNKSSSKPVPGKQKVMPSSKSGVIINP